MPVPIANVPAAPSLYFAGATIKINRPNPTTCNPAMTATIPPARRHSDGDIDDLIRWSRDGGDNDEAFITSPLRGPVMDGPCSQAERTYQRTVATAIRW